jgi:hypothetical protein
VQGNVSDSLDTSDADDSSSDDEDAKLDRRGELQSKAIERSINESKATWKTLDYGGGDQDTYTYKGKQALVWHLVVENISWCLANNCLHR